MRPLADEIRPQTLDDVAGQKHLLGEGALLRRLIENGTDANLIFYGPSGTGKTTVANIIAKQANKTLYTLNATTASLQDVKNVIADVDTMLARRTLSCDRQGGTVSTLYLRPWALWLPDTAPKARRKHHKKGGDCCTCDLCAG